MIDDLGLCRFRTVDGAPRLGLVAAGQVYDISQKHSTLDDWLASASGRATQAIRDLEAMPENMAPVCSIETLLDPAQEPRLLKPVESQEIWACGVTYEMSREARKRESDEPTAYGRVYDAPRPELFFKTMPHRAVGPEEAVGIRFDSDWDVPESELALVLTPALEIVGYTVGNDMSSRDIEGENPLYLPQAKTYNRCCALGPLVRLAGPIDPLNLQVELVIHRDDSVAFEGSTSTASIHRSLESMVGYLRRCNTLPAGAILLTGTGVVPPDSFTLQDGDIVEITIEGIGTLRNPVVVIPES